jgi:hypothetical protein
MNYCRMQIWLCWLWRLTKFIFRSCGRSVTPCSILFQVSERFITCLTLWYHLQKPHSTGASPKRRPPNEPHQVLSPWKLPPKSSHCNHADNVIYLTAVPKRMGSERVLGAWNGGTSLETWHWEANRWLHLYLFIDGKRLHSTDSLTWDTWSMYMWF